MGIPPLRALEICGTFEESKNFTSGEESILGPNNLQGWEQLLRDCDIRHISMSFPVPLRPPEGWMTCKSLHLVQKILPFQTMTGFYFLSSLKSLLCIYVVRYGGAHFYRHFFCLVHKHFFRKHIKIPLYIWEFQRYTRVFTPSPPLPFPFYFFLPLFLFSSSTSSSSSFSFSSFFPSPPQSSIDKNRKITQNKQTNSDDWISICEINQLYAIVTAYQNKGTEWF